MYGHVFRGFPTACDSVYVMTTYTEQEIDRLHEKLAGIYRRGRLNAAEVLEARGLWARIERLSRSVVEQRNAERARILSRAEGTKEEAVD